MSKSKIILIITIVLIFLSLAIGYFLSQSKNKPVSQAAVRVVLGQTPDYKLSLKVLSSETAYFSDYKLVVPYGYYNLKILGDKEKVLFSGRVGKNKVAFPPDEIGAEESEFSSTGVTLEPLTEMTLFLPFFSTAKKIVFFDENNLEKFQIDVSKLSLPKDKSH